MLKCFCIFVYLLVTVKNVLYFWDFKQYDRLFSLLINFHFLIIVSHKYMLTPILFVVSIFYRSFLSMQSICGMMRGWRPVSSAQTSISSSTVHSSEYLLKCQLYSYIIVLSTLMAGLCWSYVMFAMWRFLVVCSTTHWIICLFVRPTGAVQCVSTFSSSHFFSSWIPVNLMTQ